MSFRYLINYLLFSCWKIYNQKYGETYVGNDTYLVGKYAPEVVARDVTNSMSIFESGLSGSGQLALSNPYLNSGLLPYTPPSAPRTNIVFINDGTVAGTVINQVGLNGHKPTVLSSVQKL